MYSVPIAGIDDFMKREISFHLREDPQLADICIGTLHLLQQGVDLVNQEMLVIFNEIRYWREASEASPLGKVYTKLLKQGPLHFLTTARSLFENEKTFVIEDGLIDLRISILLETFNRLATLLGNLHECGSDIRRICRDYNKLKLDSRQTNIKIYTVVSEESFSSANISPELTFALLQSGRARVAGCLRRICEVFASPAEAPCSLPSEEDREENDVNGSVLDRCATDTASPTVTDIVDLYKNACRAVSEVAADWPSAVAANFVRQPTHFQRNWVQYTALGVLGLYALGSGVRHVRNGNMQLFVEKATLIIESNFQEHIRDPLVKLGSELFDTLRNRDEIVTVEEFNASRETLKRMLKEYSSRAGVPGGAGAMGAEDSYERTMDHLMKTYESEMSNPLKGLMFGSMMTAMLIQMQKLKMHTEAAMLTMDRVIKSNELTMAMTAAIPGLAIIGGIFYGTYRLLWGHRRSSSSRQKSNQLKLRLALTEVERVLVESAKMEETDSLAVEAADRKYRAVRRLHSKGHLYFELYRFHECLAPIFALPRRWVLMWIPRSWQQYFRWGLGRGGSMIGRLLSSAAKWEDDGFSQQELGYDSGTSSAFHSSGIGASISSEVDGVRRDILDLLNPDIDAQSKLNQIGRMKTSYGCLARMS